MLSGYHIRAPPRSADSIGFVDLDHGIAELVLKVRLHLLQESFLDLSNPFSAHAELVTEDLKRFRLVGDEPVVEDLLLFAF